MTHGRSRSEHEGAVVLIELDGEPAPERAVERPRETALGAALLAVALVVAAAFLGRDASRPLDPEPIEPQTTADRPDLSWDDLPGLVDGDLQWDDLPALLRGASRP